MERCFAMDVCIDIREADKDQVSDIHSCHS